jgi:formate/nitrite transporter FocA (FNT family)
VNGERELKRSNAALGWSGLAAGLSIGLSFMAEGVLRVHLPDADWTPLVSKLGYPFGYLVVILGRQQLFTENTLTPVLVLASNRDRKTLLALLRLWAVVLAANLVGCHLIAWVFGNSSLFEADVRREFAELGEQALAVGFWSAMLRGVFAGWIIALIVWILAAIETGRFLVVFLLTYLVGLAGLTHIIVGSIEVLFLVMTGAESWFHAAAHYMIPTLIGNTVGGVALVSALNHAQVVSDL